MSKLFERHLSDVSWVFPGASSLPDMLETPHLGRSSRRSSHMPESKLVPYDVVE